MNFSVVLIARNEEKTLPRLQRSLSQFQGRGGEVILLDTGSTDKTAALARSFGFKVTEVGEKFVTKIDAEYAKRINERFVVKGEKPVVEEGDKLFDYSAARNFAATLASNDMIATPDCDEAYTMFDLDKVSAVIEAGAEQLEYQFVFSHDRAGNAVIQFLHCKFYNRTKLKWVGIVHEVLQGEAKRQYLDESIIKLEHWQEPAEHRARYLAGLALDCFMHPENDRNSHYFAREMMWSDRPKSALREFARHIAMNKWPAERAQSMIFVGDIMGKQNRPESQTEWYHRAFYFDSSRREPLMKLARFYFHNKTYAAAAAYAAAALEIPKSSFYANDMTDYTNGPHEILYQAKGWLGDIEGAKHHLVKALQYQPRNEQYKEDTKFYFPKISFVIPTLGRPEGLAHCLKSIERLVYAKELVEVIVIEDAPRIGVPLRVKEGVESATGEYIVFGSNDVEFAPDSIITALQMKKGLVAFNTGPLLPDKGNICEHFIIRHDLIDRIGGEIFDTEFHHVGVDNLLWAKCSKLNEAVRCEEALVIHKHFSKGAPMDEVYEEGWSRVEYDRALLAKKLEALNAS